MYSSIGGSAGEWQGLEYFVRPRASAADVKRFTSGKRIAFGFRLIIQCFLNDLEESTTTHDVFALESDS